MLTLLCLKWEAPQNHGQEKDGKDSTYDIIITNKTLAKFSK